MHNLDHLPAPRCKSLPIYTVGDFQDPPSHAASEFLKISWEKIT